MKNQYNTFDIVEIENGEMSVGETCSTVKMQDALAEQLLHDPDSCGVIDMVLLEFLLQHVEILQGRRFVPDSIKHFELAKEG